MKKVSYKPIILPSEDSELKSFIEKNKTKMMENVLNSIEYSLDNDLSSVEVFRFKQSDFIITLNRGCFLENVENIYKYYIENQEYELCPRVKNIIFRLTKNYER